jgi:DNA-binding NarL/FixJ family response regulator
MPEPSAENQLPDLFNELRWTRLASHFGLSARQVETARLMCRGLRKRDIAKTLDVSVSAVRLHTARLFQRLRVCDRIGVPVRLVLADRALRAKTKTLKVYERPS